MITLHYTYGTNVYKRLYMSIPNAFRNIIIKVTKWLPVSSRVKGFSGGNLIPKIFFSCTSVIRNKKKSFSRTKNVTRSIISYKILERQVSWFHHLFKADSVNWRIHSGVDNLIDFRRYAIGNVPRNVHCVIGAYRRCEAPAY